ncbi:MAG TPA: SLC13 family permease, partial [Gammaproteobacteria bacterium]
MGIDAWITVAVVASTLAVLIGTRVSPDLVMVAAVTVLMLTGVLPVAEALSGLANPGLATVGVLYIVAAGLVNTGAAHALGTKFLGLPRSTAVAQIRLMLPAAAASGFLNNTPLVAMLVPVVEEWGRRCRISLSKLMIPLSYATILGGMLTLIGTSTNVVVYGLVLEDTTLGPMGFWEIGLVGLPCAIVGLLYMVATQKWLLPERKPPLADFGAAREYAIEMLLQDNSPMIGKSVEQAGLRQLPGAFLAEIERGPTVLPAVAPTEKLQAGDRLLFVGVVDSVAELLRLRGLVPAPEQLFKLSAPRPERRLFEVVVSDTCPVTGRTIRDGRFRTRYNAVVLAVARNGERLRAKIGDIELRAGDTLLLESGPNFLAQQRNSRDFLLVSELQGVTIPRHDKMWVAVGILGIMVVLASTGLLSMLEAALVASGLMLATRCIKPNAARASIDWSVLAVIAASFGVGQALETSGVAQMLADFWIGAAGTNPLLALAAMYVFTNVVTEMVSNNAAAVMSFPIAVATAEGLGVSLWPFVVVVMMAASCGFATPIGYQTNLMVYGPGGYRFSDYVRFGLPLNVLVGVVTVLLAPVFWPF